MSNAETKVSAKQAYEKLKTKRSTYIDRGVKCAKVTIHIYSLRNQQMRGQSLVHHTNPLGLEV